MSNTPMTSFSEMKQRQDAYFFGDVSEEQVEKWASAARKIRGSFQNGVDVYGVPVNVEVNGSIVTVDYQIKPGQDSE